MYQPIILIDNGHGRNTPGKCSPAASKGLTDSPYYFREYAWARQCARGIVSELRKLGLSASLRVSEEDDIILRERAARVNAYCRTNGKENVLLVSIHVNAAGRDGKWMTARGWSAFTTKGITEADRLAACLIDAAENTFRAPLRVRKYSMADRYSRDFEENFYILKNTSCPAVLTENFFQDNREDVLYLKSTEGLNSCIRCHVDGITRYINAKNNR